RETEQINGAVLFLSDPALSEDWQSEVKKKHPKFFLRHEERLIHPGGVLCSDNRLIIPIPLRKTVLDSFHKGYFTVERIWRWSQMNFDSCAMVKHCDASVSKQFLTKGHLVAVENLKRNENILISKPDKGSGIVLLIKANYINKIRTILDDQTKFRKMENEKDKTPQIEEAISKSLRCLKQRGIIDSTTIGTTISRLYGLSKIHKIGVPLRPILDVCNSPYHPLCHKY
ncbi:uncharacterized protein DEA37_0008207, partial [Paragonimus westermani]